MTVLKLVSEPETRPRVRLTCWGDFALADAGTGDSLRPRGRKARALFAYLALHGGRPVSRERITGLLAEGLSARGVDVTLFATLDSVTSARLSGVSIRSLENSPTIAASRSNSSSKWTARSMTWHATRSATTA